LTEDICKYHTFHSDGHFYVCILGSMVKLASSISRVPYFRCLQRYYQDKHGGE